MALIWNPTDFIPEKKINNLLWEDPKVSVQLVDKYGSLATAISESNLTVLYMYSSWNCITNRRSGGGGLKIAFTVALKAPSDPYGIWTVSG